jgi:hypothetical protein
MPDEPKPSQDALAAARRALASAGGRALSAASTPEQRAARARAAGLASAAARKAKRRTQ